MPRLRTSLTHRQLHNLPDGPSAWRLALVNSLPVHGNGREPQIVIEFPDYDAAVGCYHDPEYAAAHQIRI